MPYADNPIVGIAVIFVLLVLLAIAGPRKRG
jgi:hypothetical protein